MSIIRPSPAITVSEHTSIGETIQTLIEHKVGSVIITSYSAPHRPVGIFTERDLLRWVFDFNDRNQWNVAIGTIMTKNLITLSLLNLDQANSLMLQNNIRHVPVVYQDENGEEHLAGVISMREAFRALYQENFKLLKKLGALSGKKTISVLAKNPKDQQLQEKILSDHSKVEIIQYDFNKALSVEKLLPQILLSDIFIIDIDGLSVHFWPILLRSILDETKHPEVYVVYNPVHHESKNIEALKTIAAGNIVHAFSKPVNLLLYLSQIETSLTK